MSECAKDVWRVSSARRLFLLLAPLIYASFALLTPPFETPDEHQHLFRAWQLSELHLIGERRESEAGGSLPPSLGRAAALELGGVAPHVEGRRKIAHRAPAAAFQRMTPLQLGEQPQFFSFLGSVIYSPAGYIPQICAIWIGRLLGLPVEAILLLGRLLNSLLTITLFYSALCITPLGVRAIFWLGLFPMTASAAASFGQDGMVIGGGALLTATGLRLLRDERWMRADLIRVAVLALLLTLSKLFYLPLALIGALPWSGDKPNWRRLGVLLSICAAIAVLAIFWMKGSAGVLVNPRSDVPPVMARLSAWAAHPEQPIILLYRTFIEKGHDLADTLFTFGWLNIGPVRAAGLPSLIALGIVLYAGDRRVTWFDWKSRLWLLLLAAASALLISMALYFYWTRGSFQGIDGLQGRYFLPLAVAVLLAITPARERLTGIALPAVAFLLLIANLASIAAILQAFYG